MEKIMKKVSHLEHSSKERANSSIKVALRVIIIDFDQMPSQNPSSIQIECEGERLRTTIDPSSSYPPNYEFPFHYFMKHSWIKVSFWQKRPWLGINKLQREEKLMGEANFNLTKGEIESGEAFWIDLIGQVNVLPRFKIKIVFDNLSGRSSESPSGLQTIQKLSVRPIQHNPNSNDHISENKIEFASKLLDNFPKSKMKKKKKKIPFLTSQKTFEGGNFDLHNHFNPTTKSSSKALANSFRGDFSFSTIDTSQTFSSPGSSSRTLEKSDVNKAYTSQSSSTNSLSNSPSPTRNGKEVSSVPIKSTNDSFFQDLLNINLISSDKHDSTMTHNNTFYKDDTQQTRFANNQENNTILDEIFSSDFPLSNNSQNSSQNHSPNTLKMNGHNSFEIDVDNPFETRTNVNSPITTLSSDFFPIIPTQDKSSIFHFPTISTIDNSNNSNYKNDMQIFHSGNKYTPADKIFDLNPYEFNYNSDILGSQFPNFNQANNHLPKNGTAKNSYLFKELVDDFSNTDF